MSFILLIWKNLSRRGTRSVLTVAGVAIGVGAVVAMAGIAWGFEQSWQRTYTERGTDLIVTRVTSHSPLPAAFERERAIELERIPGVDSVAVLLSDLLSIEDAPTMLVMGWEPGSFLWEHLVFREGGPRIADEAGSWVYLGVLAADALGKRTGDLIQVEDREMRVAGIFESGALLENGSAIFPLEALQNLLGHEGKVNFLNLRVSSGTTPARLEELRAEIERRMPGFKAFQAGEVARHNTGIQAAKAMSLATSIIALVVGALGVMNTVLMSVFERTREIGLLVAVGWRRSRVMAMILLESVILCLMGAVAGTGLGIGAVRTMQELPFMRGRIEGEFGPGLLISAFVIALGLGVLGGLYPAIRGASLQPSEALRTE